MCNAWKENNSKHAAEVTATEESPVASRPGEILRRPMIACQTTEFGVGLLRMTLYNGYTSP